MADLLQSMAVQSYCFRAFKDNALVAAMVKKLGLSGIELCNVHCNFLDPAGWDAALDAYRRAGVRIVSIGVEKFEADEPANRRRFEFAARAGCQMISANFSPFTFQAALPICYKLCDEFGIDLAIHNHGGYHWLGSGEMLDWVFACTRPCIKLNMDTAWALDARQNPVQWVERYAGRLAALHLKDFVFDRARMGQDVIVGQGNVKLPELFAKLRSVGFAGEMIVEYEGDKDNPLPKLTECVQAIRAAE